MRLSWAAATPRISTARAGRRSSNPSSVIARTFLYAEEAGRIVGVLPLAHVASWLFGSALVSLPFAVYGGVAADSPQAANALEDEAQALARRLGVAHLELRNVRARHPDWPTQDLYVTFRKEILPDVEANMLAIPRKQRAMVRKGAKHGLSSEIDGNADRFYALFLRQRPSARHTRSAEAILRSAAAGFRQGLRGADDRRPG
jgi:FemAB-related protein (PEP-CTERM system-associated)